MSAITPTPVAIRRAEPADLARVVDVWMEGAFTSFGVSKIAYEDASQFFAQNLDLQSEIFGIWVALDQGELVGWQALLPCRNNPIDACTVTESSTYVSSASRSKGIGRALLTFAQEHARRVGMKELRGHVIAVNSPCVKLIESLGWTNVGALPRASADKPSVVLYAYAVSAQEQ